MTTSNFKKTLLILFTLFSTSVFATAPQSIFDVLNFKAELAVTIELDMTALTSDIRNNEKRPAVLTFEDHNGIAQEWKIKAALRGKFRRMRCAETPPLKLYFDKTDLKNAGLAKYDDLKLVNYCHEDKAIAKELIIKEYLAYKMYNVLTEKSFRVQLLKITYKDTTTGKKTKQWGFLIEDTAQLRSRIGANKFEQDIAVQSPPYHDKQIQMVALFQYMIGNTDWLIKATKNIKAVEKDGKLLAIPYDFDFSGLVNPPYGFANSNFNLTTMTERVYLGDSTAITDIGPILTFFKHKQQDLYKVVSSNKHLSLFTKEEIRIYLDSFFENATIEAISATIPNQENSLKGLTSTK